MCGIAALWGSSAADCADVVTLMQLLTPVINNRGPDYHSSLVVEGVTLLCSVLHIQGDEITVQPQSDSDGNLLLWNGEVFGGLDYSVGVESDTVAVSRLLQSCTTLLSSPFEVAGAIAECLKGVQGPYAFVFMHKSTGSVHFARDPIGRRSLIAIYHNDSIVGIASVALDLLGFLEGYSLQEMSVEGIFTLALKSPDRVVSTSPWPADTIKLKRRNSFTNNDSVDESLVSYSSLEREFLIVLQEAVGKRVRSISKHCHSTIEQKCRVGVLFSGGIDSVMLAALLHLCLEHVNEPIELINVTFYSEDDRASEPPSPDRLAAIGAYVELKTVYPDRDWRLVLVDVDMSERLKHEEHIRNLISPCDTHMDLNIGTAFWFAARGRGHLVDANSDAISQLYEIKDNDRPLLRLGGEGARDGVGLSEEKERIVSLRREKLHSSDLNSKIGKPSADKCSKEKCNRVVKIGCINGYCKRCCDKIGNLSDAGDACLVHNKRDARNQSRKYEENIEITQTSDNVDYKLLEMLSSRTAEYSCQCKALLVGIGADEQMAGYGRHRTVFMKSSWEGLQEELNMDMARLWKRNLGRDDRCISDNGREAWFPYLDEDFVKFLQNHPLHQLIDLRKPQGVGDKMVLREAAKSVGLGSCTLLVKRAIQFGTRVAKHTNTRFHGSNRKGKGDAKL